MTSRPDFDFPAPREQASATCSRVGSTRSAWRGPEREASQGMGPAGSSGESGASRPSPADDDALCILIGSGAAVCCLMLLALIFANTCGGPA